MLLVGISLLGKYKREVCILCVLLLHSMQTNCTLKSIVVNFPHTTIATLFMAPITLRKWVYATNQTSKNLFFIIMPTKWHKIFNFHGKLHIENNLHCIEFLTNQTLPELETLDI